MGRWRFGVRGFRGLIVMAPRFGFYVGLNGGVRFTRWSRI